LDNSLGALDHILGLHLRLAHGAVQRHFGEHFAELGLTQKQVSVLWLAEAQPGIAQTDLAQRLQMDRATTMAIVHALEKRGLLARGRASDARRVALSLTEEGHAILVEARRAIDVHEAWLRGRFTKAEAKQLVELLRRIHD
jgi:DNA-binding MarR family transcriptional regulator